MIRTIWLGLFCLVAICIVAAVKVATKASSLSVSEVIENAAADSEPVAFGLNVQPDTLSKADKLPIPYFREEIPEAKVVSHTQVVAQPPARPSAMGEKIISRHWHDPNPLVTTGKRATHRPAKNNEQSKKTGDAAKSVAETTLCSNGGVHNLLRSLNLSPACASSFAPTDAPARSNRATAAK